MNEKILINRIKGLVKEVKIAYFIIGALTLLLIGSLLVIRQYQSTLNKSVDLSQRCINVAKDCSNALDYCVNNKEGGSINGSKEENSKSI